MKYLIILFVLLLLVGIVLYLYQFLRKFLKRHAEEAVEENQKTLLRIIVSIEVISVLIGLLGIGIAIAKWIE